MTEIHTTATLRSSERVIAGTTVVALSGEIDLLTAQPLSARLDMLTAGLRPDLVLDLRAVSFVDCAGLGVLCRAVNRTAVRGGRLRFVTGNTGFLRILRHAQLGGVFEIHTRLPNALAAKPESGDTSATAG
ncbi:anti-sigma B factor antagonist [Streptomyces sp. 3213]|uniref:STAS domain-containing protein n=1 Tax=Streptomyces sp. 3213.3 TaxID=1855348 RepID=UPI00089A76E8|nr:STAS domain-containing protein [Streptomyces sp. 3213.3]SEC76278.1 anti-sigma B factor antagonist [Streptomyces sp. 3213] [Streptomyces sp. 3213.3]